MLKRTGIAGISALFLSLGLALAAPASANAGSIGFEFGVGNGAGRVIIGTPHYGHRSHRYSSGHSYGICTPREAIHKARRMGVRHARIDRMGHRYITVEGRRHGSGVEVSFYKRSRNCSVASIERDRRHHRGSRQHYGYRSR